MAEHIADGSTNLVGFTTKNGIPDLGEVCMKNRLVCRTGTDEIPKGWQVADVLLMLYTELDR